MGDDCDVRDQEAWKSLRDILGSNESNASAVYWRFTQPYPALQQVIHRSLSCADEYLEDPRYLEYPGEAACALLLLLTSNVNTLHLVLPSFDTGEYAFLRDIFTSAVPGLLPRLCRLRLVSDPFAASPQLPESAPEDFMAGRLAGQKIKTVELYGADLVAIDVSKEAWQEVQFLRMQASCVSGDWFHRLCRDARPPLRVLQIQPSLDLEYDIWDPDGPGLNEALSFCTRCPPAYGNYPSRKSILFARR
ncbi:hypothetical protein VTJ49DRAFT_7298 [Mycothermus thermophilus]|uniref:Uncharacterized protein n=1 Tax=Humicola insolens TaxID=85995 RepID=A0ABR3VH86_HUMIN